jgi:alkylation response protein AidB-like acyl-CoA dehydrogenase
VLVPAAAPGVTVTPRGAIDLVRRFATVTFAGVRVPRTAVVTEGAATGPAVERQLDIAASLQLAEVVGAIDRVLEFTIEWAFDRFTFGRQLASYQALKHRFADMRLWLEATKATTAAAIHAVDAGTPDAPELVSVAKSYVGEHAPELVQDCVQMHGGIGVTWDHDLHLYLRRVTLDCALSGTVTDHRRRLAAVIAAA